MTIINGQGRFGVRTYVAPVSLSSIVTSGLVLNLDAGNAASYSGTGTTWTDLTGNGNNGTLINGTSYSSTSGGTLAFDGINDYVSLNSNSINSLTRFTFNIWFKTPSIAKEQVLFSTVNSTQTMGYHIEFYTSKILMQVFPSGGYTYASSVLSSNTWYNITVSYDNGNIAYYNNGIQDGSATRTFNVSTATTFIGKWGGGAIYDLVFGGNIAHVSFYDRVLTSAEVLQNFNSTKSRFGFASYTTRTTAFAAATGITDTTILNALNTFDTGLISNGLDTKMKALYPMVGGTSTTHKFNFMDARDSNAAFRLSFNGGGVHSLTGYKPNGTNAYADTFYNQNTQGDNVNSGHLSYYSRTNSNGSEVEIGTTGGANTLLRIRTSGLTYPLINQGGDFTTFADADSLGFYVANRNASNVINCWKGGVKKVSGTNLSNVVSSYYLYLGALNISYSTYYSTKECAFASIGSGLTDSEATTFYNLVQAFQTALSRQV